MIDLENMVEMGLELASLVCWEMSMVQAVADVYADADSMVDGR